MYAGGSYPDDDMIPAYAMSYIVSLHESEEKGKTWKKGDLLGFC